MYEHHILQLLSGIIQWIDPPDAVSKAIECGKSERSYPCLPAFSCHMALSSFYVYNSLTLVLIFSEMLDGCRALLSIATVTTPSMFDRLLKSIRSVEKRPILLFAYNFLLRILSFYLN